MEPKQKSNGALAGSIIIIVILIIGGIYLWNKNREENSQVPSSDTSSAGTDANSMSNLDTNVKSVNIDNIDNGI